MAKLLEAGIAELATYGYQGARVGRVATTAGTSHGTFYVYFKDKDDLLATLYEELLVEHNEIIQSMPALEAGPAGYEALRSWLVDVCEDYRKHAPVRVAMHDAMQFESDRRLATLALRSLRTFTGIVAERIKASGSRDLDPDLAALCITNLINAAGQAAARPSVKASFDELVDGLTEIVHRAVFGASAS